MQEVPWFVIAIIEGIGLGVALRERYYDQIKTRNLQLRKNLSWLALPPKLLLYTIVRKMQV